MRTDILASVLERERPKFIYTLPTYQNPSGVVMSTERRHHLLELAARWQLPVIEDDPYSELRYEGDPPPSLKALDDEDRVVYLSTFSKAIMPGLRVGYVVAPPVVLRQLVLAKQGADLHTNSFGQYLFERFLRLGHFTSHLELVRAAYRKRRDVMAEALNQAPELGLDFTPPDGGLYIWCRIPDGIEQSALLADAVKRGVVFLPGRACYATDPPENCIRLNFSMPSEQAIEDGIDRLLDVMRDASAFAPRRRAEGPTTSPVV